MKITDPELLEGFLRHFPAPKEGDLAQAARLLPQLELVMASATEFNPEIEREYWPALRRDAINIFVSTSFSLETVRNAMKRVEGAYLKKTKNKYVLLTELSMESKALLGRRKHGDAEIILAREFPKIYLPAREEAMEIVRNRLPEARPGRRRTACRITVKARTADEAYYRASRAIDRLRGLWVFGLTSGTTILEWSAPDVPKSSIIRGPVDTVHAPSGELARDGNHLWYHYPYPDSYGGITLPPLSVERIKKYEKWIKKKLAHSAMSELLKDAVAWWAKALDNFQVQERVFDLWSLLEWLCSKEKDRAEYDRVISRAAALYPDQKHHRSVLESLRHHRNRIVHDSVERLSSVDHTGEEGIVLLLKDYAGGMLRFAISHANRWSHRDSFCEYLDDLRQLEKLRDDCEEFRSRCKESELLRLAVAERPLFPMTGEDVTEDQQ